MLSVEAGLCLKKCDHGFECLERAGHVPGDRHETEHGCVFYDAKPPTMTGWLETWNVSVGFRKSQI